MQRGAGKNPKKRLTLQEEYEQTQIVLTAREKLHFGEGLARAGFVETLRPTIKNLAKSGVRKPRDVSRLLNSMRITTAIGEKWTRRLAWFLLDRLFADEASSQPKVLPAKTATQASRPKTLAVVPLTGEERARSVRVLQNHLNSKA
jgi:hypothetical protein